jgi:hypothetical protein
MLTCATNKALLGIIFPSSFLFPHDENRNAIEKKMRADLKRGFICIVFYLE